MTKLTRFDPFQGMTRWGENLDEFFNDFWKRRGDDQTALLSPSVDVSEDASQLRITAELPGLEKKDIDLNVRNNVLTVRGEKRMEDESREGKFHRIERRYGSFYRALALPDTVDTDQVNASFKNGVLTVTLPKKEESKPRAIDIAD